VKDLNDSMQVMEAYGKAYTALSPLFSHFPFLTLLRRALQSHILIQTRHPITTAKLAHSLQMDEKDIISICLALDAYGILRKEQGFYILEDQWMILTDPALPFPLSHTLENVFAQAHVVEHMIEGRGDYWNLPSSIRLALAKGVTINPLSPYSPSIIRFLIEQTATQLHTRFLSGARYLEMGCGVAGGLLCLLQAYPALIAVGVDISEDVLDEAQRQASTLGVTERVNFVQSDVRNLVAREEYDVVFWSQFYFPTASRADALRVAMQALTPEGFLMAPLFEEPLTTRENIRSEEGKRFVLNRLTYGYWGIPAVGGEQLRVEIENSGFTDVQLIQTPLNRVVLARKGNHEQEMLERSPS
jgi:2-polyprenyl-3-methyl-5-hydroxy-6-metoxy-1,4-benzoquinol methylase